MDRLPQVSHTSTAPATAHPSTTPPDFENPPPDWVDYEPAERELYAALTAPDGEARILARDFGHQFGTDVASDEIVADFADALYTKALDLLSQQGTIRAFGHAHLLAKCQKWARYWCDLQQKAQQWAHDQAKAIARNYADRLAWALARYGDWEGFAKGQKGSIEKRSARSRWRKKTALWMKDQGHTRKEIAAVVGVKVRQVTRYLRVEVEEVVKAVADKVKGWTFGKGKSYTDTSDSEDGNGTALAKCPPPGEANQADLERPEIPADERCRGPDPAQSLADLAALYPHRAAELAKLTQ